MAVFSPDVTEDELPGAIERVGGYIQGVGGTIVSTNQESPWGRRRLAYPIRYQGRDVRDGYYVLFFFDAASSQIAEIEREIRLNDKLIRHNLTIRGETPPAVEPEEGAKRRAPPKHSRAKRRLARQGRTGARADRIGGRRRPRPTPPARPPRTSRTMPRTPKRHRRRPKARFRKWSETMAGIAKVTIVGNLGRDPETRYLPSGVMNVSFTMAVTRRRTDQNGQQQESTTWFRVTAWRKLAEIIDGLAQRGAVVKGRQVLVIGSIEAREYQGQDGQMRTSLDVTADEFQLLGTRADNEGQDSGLGQPQRQQDSRRPSESEAATSDFDDVPF